MSYMKGDLLTKTRRLVKGFAIRESLWLTAMEKAPPVVFPRSDGKMKAITLPEDIYVNKFYQRHPESKYEDPIKLSSFNPVPARIFASRVLELKVQGVKDEEAMAVADAYTRLRQIARIQGKKHPPNPYPSAIKQIQAEERPYVRERFFNPQILDIVNKLKEDKAAEMKERFGGQQRVGGQERFGQQQRFSRQGRFAGGQGFGGHERFAGQGF